VVLQVSSRYSHLADPRNDRFRDDVVRAGELVVVVEAQLV
jgi:hypothetical protein